MRRGAQKYLHFDYKNKISHWPQGNYLERESKGINLYVSDSLNVYKNCSLVVIQILMLVKDQRLQLTKHILNVNHTSRY